MNCNSKYLLALGCGLLAACNTTNRIESGIYQFVAGQRIEHLLTTVATVNVDVDTHRVNLRYIQGKQTSFSGSPLPNNNWRNTCHTNTGSEKLEVWTLTPEKPGAKPIGHLVAGCFGEGVILELNNRSASFNSAPE